MSDTTTPTDAQRAEAVKLAQKVYEDAAKNGSVQDAAYHAVLGLLVAKDTARAERDKLFAALVDEQCLVIDLKAQLAAAEGRAEKWQAVAEGLHRYAKHGLACQSSILRGLGCICGLSDALKAYDTLAAAEQGPREVQPAPQPPDSVTPEQVRGAVRKVEEPCATCGGEEIVMGEHDFNKPCPDCTDDTEGPT